ncbi:beta subunit of fatty acid synthase [Hortaea werneckii]|nr:beta subunit of fatty acid synthase [Hortaea werneckii]
MGDGTRQLSILRKDARNVDRVVVARDTSWDRVLKVHWLVQSLAITLKVVEHGAAPARPYLASAPKRRPSRSYSNVLSGCQVDLDRGLHLTLKSVLVIRVGASVQELAGDLHDWLTVACDSATDLDHLTRSLVDNSVDLGSSVKDVALLQRCGARDHTEPVGEPTTMAKSMGAKTSLPGRSTNASPVFPTACTKSLMASLVTVALPPSNRLVTGVSNGTASSPNQMRSVTGFWVVCELERQRNWLAKSSAVFDHVDWNLTVADGTDLNSWHVLAVGRLLHGDNGPLGIVRVQDLNHHAWGGSKDAVHRVGVIPLTLDEHIRREEGMTPGVARTSQKRRPVLDARHGSEVVRPSILTSSLASISLPPKYSTTGILLESPPYKILGGHRPLEDGNTADILIDNRLQIFGLPERPAALNERVLGSSANEALFHTADEVASQASQRLVDPSLLVLDVHKLYHSAKNIAIGHVLQVDTLAILVATEPWLLEVVIELLDDVVPVLLELRNALSLVESEDLLVHLRPEQNTTRGKLVFSHSESSRPGASTMACLAALEVHASLATIHLLPKSTPSNGIGG